MLEDREIGSADIGNYLLSLRLVDLLFFLSLLWFVNSVTTLPFLFLTQSGILDLKSSLF